MHILIRSAVYLWHQATAVVNQADHRLTAGVGNCCKQTATLGTCWSQSSSVVLMTPKSNRRRASFIAQRGLLAYVAALFVCLFGWFLLINLQLIHFLPFCCSMLCKWRDLCCHAMCVCVCLSCLYILSKSGKKVLSEQITVSSVFFRRRVAKPF